MYAARGLKKIEKILIIKLRYIGDTVLVTPLLDCIKSSFPSVSVDILVNQMAVNILLDHPGFHRIYGFDKKAGGLVPLRLMRQLRTNRYDLVIDLTNNDRSMLFTRLSGAPIRVGFRNRHRILQNYVYSIVIDSDFGHIHTVDHHLKVVENLGLPVTTRHPILVVGDESRHKVRDMLSIRDIDLKKGYVVIHHAARRWYKSWPRRNFAQLADRIIECYGLSVLFVGGDADRVSADKIIREMRNSALNLSGEVPLRYLPALLEGAICLVGNDSAPIHVATAVATPVVALFGPTDAQVWGPRREHDVTISADFPCKPCGHKNVDCPLGESYCMSTIELDQVWSAVDRIIADALLKLTERR